MGTRLYIGNLAFTTTEDQLKDIFSECGEVLSCNLITDKFTGKSRGFGFVEMASQEAAQKAVSELDGKDVDGRRLKVNEARPREERPPRNFGDDRGPRGGRGAGRFEGRGRSSYDR